jgi:hypothetical protein
MFLQAKCICGRHNGEAAAVALSETAAINERSVVAIEMML